MCRIWIESIYTCSAFQLYLYTRLYKTVSQNRMRCRHRVNALQTQRVRVETYRSVTLSDSIETRVEFIESWLHKSCGGNIVSCRHSESEYNALQTDLVQVCHSLRFYECLQLTRVRINALQTFVECVADIYRMRCRHRGNELQHSESG